MKRLSATLLGVALTAVALPSAAQPAAEKTTTTVTKVKGPLKLLPHHKRKYCRTRWVNHKRVKKCWYH